MNIGPNLDLISRATRAVFSPDELTTKAFTVSVAVSRALTDLGMPAAPVVGYAGWRTGPGRLDNVIHHTDADEVVVLNMPPAPAEAHAWVLTSSNLIDMTTCSLSRKAKLITIATGEKTRGKWSPNYLVVPRSEVKTDIEAFRRARKPGSCFYLEDPRLAPIVTDELSVSRLRGIERAPKIVAAFLGLATKRKTTH